VGLDVVRAAVLLATGLAAGLAALGSAEENADNIYRLPIGDPARRDREAPVVLDAITDTATASGAPILPSELPKRLEGVRLLLVGESHTDVESHRIEARVLEQLVRAGRRVTVGLEMYPYTEQAALDDWIAGKLTEEAFLEASRWYRSWGYNWLYYRDIFLYARDRRLPLLAINAPREVVSAVRRKGFQNLTPEEAAHVPTEVDSKNAEHLRLFKASFGPSGFHTGMDEKAWQSMLDAQCTWDATMGFHAIQPLRSDEDPRAIVVVLVGAGHVQYGLGIERQVRKTFRGRIASLIPVPVEDPELGRVDAVQASYANFVWGTPPEGDPLYPELGIATRVRPDDGQLEVLEVEKNSPAAAAGLKAGDVLLSLDASPVRDKEILARAMAAKRWGDAAELTVRRDGEPVAVRVLLRRKPPAA
jgi:aminopeptidase N